MGDVAVAESVNSQVGGDQLFDMRRPQSVSVRRKDGTAGQPPRLIGD